MDLQNFLEMGGYAQYVWPAYGLTALVLVWNWWAARRSETDAQTAARRRIGTCLGDTAHDTATEAHGDRGRHPGRRRHRHAFALKAFNQNLLYYYSPTQIQRGRGAVGAHVPRRRAGRERQREAPAGQPRGHVHADRLPADSAGELHGRAAGPVPRRAGHHRARQARRRPVRRRGSARQARRELHAARGQGQPEAAHGRGSNCRRPRRAPGST